MKTITLSLGFVTKVDDTDYEELSKLSWYAYKNGKKYGNWYAARSQQPRIFMHTLLIDPKGFYIDHADSDSLNNQRYNLRIATGSQNSANRRISSTKKGVQYMGVYQRRIDGKYYGHCEKNKKRYTTGFYESLTTAVLERNKLAVRLHGEFAPISIIQP